MGVRVGNVGTRVVNFISEMQKSAEKKHYLEMYEFCVGTTCKCTNWIIFVTQQQFYVIWSVNKNLAYLEDIT